jgi:site-specific recombinase XerD
MKTPTRTVVDFSPVLLAGGNSSFKQSVADFFLCSLSNRHTQSAYANDISMLSRFLSASFDISLEDALPVHLGTFRKHLEDSEYSVSGIRRKVAAIRAFYSHLAGSGIISHSPAANLKSPKLHREQGATPIFNSKREIRTFINSYDESGVLGLRNRALFSVLFFTMARVSAVCGLNVEDIKQLPTHVVLVFREKRGKVREVPLNSFAADILLRYVRRAEIYSGAIFRSGTIKGSDVLSRRRITRNTVHYLMKSRLKKLGLNLKLSSHSWRGSGATMYLQAEGSRLEHAQKILGHGSVNTTRLYDRRKNSIPLLEVERLSF